MLTATPTSTPTSIPLLAVHVNIKARHITIAGPNGEQWQFAGEAVEPGYGDKRRRLISQEKFKEVEELDFRVLIRLSDKIVGLAEELGAGIA